MPSFAGLFKCFFAQNILEGEIPYKKAQKKGRLFRSDPFVIQLMAIT
jgi:hypothetical protein